MSERPDLSRWNRAGLRRFRYVDGNAAKFLEDVRQTLRSRFGDRWSSLPEPPDISDEAHAQPELAAHQRNRQLVEQYRGERRDVAWELALAFCRASHVLADHIEANANEGFLRTATQWENVRRLAATLDYQPLGASSASTVLVIQAKPGAKGVVPRGFQVKHTPPATGHAVVFETLEDLEVASAWNTLRPANAKSSQAAVLPGPPPAASVSPVARGPAETIEGVGPVRAAALASAGVFTVQDLALNLTDPRVAEAIDIPQASLVALRAKADVVVRFRVEPRWLAALGDRTLRDMAALPVRRLAALGGASDADAAEFLRGLHLLAACLDDNVFSTARLRHMVAEPTAPGQPDDGAPPEEPPAAIEVPWLTPRKPKVSANQRAMMWHRGQQRGEAVAIAAASPGAPLRVDPVPAQHTWPRWKRGQVELRVAPGWKRAVWLNGDRVVRTAAPHGLTAGAHVAWTTNGTWRFAEVEQADRYTLRLRLVGSLPPPGTPLREARPQQPPGVMRDQIVGAVDEEALGVELREALTRITFGDVVQARASLSDLFSVESAEPGGTLIPGKLDFGSFLFPTPMLPMDLVKAAVEMLLGMGAMTIPSTGEAVFKFLKSPAALADDIVTKLGEDGYEVKWSDGLDTKEQRISEIEKRLEQLGAPTQAGDDLVIFRKMSDELVKALEHAGPVLGLAPGAPVKAVVVAQDPPYVLDRAEAALAGGGWVVAEFSEGDRAARVHELVPIPGVATDEAVGVTFMGVDEPPGDLVRVHADFRGVLEPEGASINDTELGSAELELDEPPQLLAGRTVLLSAADGSVPPMVSTVSSVDGARIALAPRPRGFTAGNLLIHANVVTASHGATVPPKVFSSEAAIAAGGELVLAVADLATVADATFPAGVRVDVDVAIDGMRWKQVDRLDLSGAADPHYVVRSTEERHARLVFGDGVRGRRLPTGTNNVRVRYRVGAGRSGNLPPDKLTNPVRPHRLVDAVAQPIASVGGEEQESVAATRARAPGALLALERCVSLRDFENLATNRPDVWQASASYHRAAAGRQDIVRVVLVPAGGHALDPHAPLARAIAASLTEHALPTVAVRVESFRPQAVAIGVHFRYDRERYNEADVEARVRDAVHRALSLERRRIAQPLYLSELYEIVEAVEGVEDSECRFETAAPVPARRLDPLDGSHVVFLPMDQRSLTVTAEVYTP